MDKNTKTILIVAAIAIGGYIAYKKFGPKAIVPAPNPVNNTSVNGVGGNATGGNTGTNSGIDWGDTATGVLHAVGDWAGWSGSEEA